VTVVAAEFEPVTASALARFGSGVRRNPTIIAGVLLLAALAALALLAPWLTASAHFTKMKHDLVRMMPDWIPQPMALIYFTGLCEIAGAIGLLLPGLRQAAGIALIVFFIVVFPANVKAARTGVGLGGKRATPLWLRSSMQILFIALTWWSALWNSG
jgi:uncharacterized membrane protein